jgi:hypothetical protein
LNPVAAAARLQRVFRGHIVRQWSTPTLRRIHVQRKALVSELSEMLIREVVEGEVIPDLLIEIITSERDAAAFAPHPPWLQQQLQLAEGILGEVVFLLFRCLLPCLRAHNNFKPLMCS